MCSCLIVRKKKEGDTHRGRNNKWVQVLLSKISDLMWSALQRHLRKLKYKNSEPMYNSNLRTTVKTCEIKLTKNNEKVLQDKCIARKAYLLNRPVIVIIESRWQMTNLTDTMSGLSHKLSSHDIKRLIKN